MARPIRISFDEGTVFCTPDKGNVWAKNPNPNQPETVEWRRGANVTNFRLRFHREAIQGNGAMSDWPFDVAPPEPPNSTGIVTTSFSAPVNNETGGVYEYTIEVNVGEAASTEAPTAFLDPMLIVGRG
jgi:hypothetical protein